MRLTPSYSSNLEYYRDLKLVLSFWILIQDITQSPNFYYKLFSQFRVSFRSNSYYDSFYYSNSWYELFSNLEYYSNPCYDIRTLLRFLIQGNHSEQRIEYFTGLKKECFIFYIREYKNKIQKKANLLLDTTFLTSWFHSSIPKINPFSIIAGVHGEEGPARYGICRYL